MTKMLVSVVMANYNRPILALRTVQSALAQQNDFINIEVIICDDASTFPIAKETLSSLGENVFYRRLPYNQGPQVARNVGINLAKGEFIVIADDDDEFINGGLQKSLDLIKMVERWNDYPVFQFARGNGIIPVSYKCVSIDDYMNGSLSGEFTAVINKEIFLKNQLAFSEEVYNVGCESLLWWKVAINWGIPTWRDCHIMSLNSDAGERLTSVGTFIKRARSFAIMEDLSLNFMQAHQLSDRFRQYYDLKLLGAASYYALAEQKAEAHNRLKQISNPFDLRKIVLNVLLYLPRFLLLKLFILYKKSK